ncbi:Cof-type HAD-IIB family hydrolase [Streptococcus orisasini]|uniref:Cof-type HAD-IIB family hydrolase n=1 Tax=Streptococcus orisasini TaxID=1080071 RepID=UPI00070B8E59|nr:Cof-type HAD-IIB family hydrolase [Streptococcus orisasini]
MNYKGLVFFDLDGTLLNKQSQISPDNKLALQELRANGYLPIIATGRSIKELKGVLKQSGITSVIMMNGMSIYIEGKEVFTQTIDSDTIDKLLGLARSLGDEIAYYTPFDIYLSGDCQGLRDHFTYFNEEHEELPPINENFYLDNPVNMLLVGSADKSHDAIYQEAISQLHFFRNSPYSIDVTKAGSDKGTGINTVKDVLNLQHIPTYAFGDGKNDIPLLLAADYAIAMENAVDDVLEVADFITHHHDQDGIRHALQHYHLI